MRRFSVLIVFFPTFGQFIQKIYVSMLFLLFVLFLPFQFVGCSSLPQTSASDEISVKKYIEYSELPAAERLFLDSLQKATFNYFLKEIEPSKGLVKDRSADWSPASIAATGFALPVWALGSEKGWITKEKAEELTLNLINFLLNSEQSAAPDATGYKGFYYHFLDLKNGKREWNSELSTVDSGFLFAGLIFARNYYSGATPRQVAIRKGADEIIARADWDFFTINNPKSEYYNGLSMGWHPETKENNGLIDHCWWGYNEALVLFIMAAGADSKDFQKQYDRWLRDYQWGGEYLGLEHYMFPPMFGHQYSHLFVEFRGIYDIKNREKGIDYCENSRRATYTQQLFGKNNPRKWVGMDSLTWGLSACDGPGEKFNRDGYKFLDYSARGFSQLSMDWNDDGTIAPTAAGGSVPFAPEITIPTLMNIKYKYGAAGLWGEYGFKDSFNPTAGWFAVDYIGIDQAPIILMIENYKNGFVWNYFMKDAMIQKGLQKLDYRKGNAE